MGKTAYLVLENGKTFRGERFGAEGEMTAEVVFHTGMTGYLETLTDRSYWGQIVVQTFPLIGNYGVISADFESDAIGPSAYIVKHWCQAPSNFRSEGSLDTFFQEKGVIGLSGIDTRSLTKLIRENGVMNGIITDDPAGADLEALKAYQVRGGVAACSTKEKYTLKPQGEPRKKVAVLDLGLKKSLCAGLLDRGAEVTVCPWNTTAAELEAMGADGVMLSCGPGDPAENGELIAVVRELCERKLPMLGVGLGHQLLALAHGFTTEKLKYGHRGANQPVKNTETGRVHITGQNHGYTVVSGSVDSQKARELFVNVNDGTCEGLRYLDCPAVSVQFYPGPQDEKELYDGFFARMG